MIDKLLERTEKKNAEVPPTTKGTRYFMPAVDIMENKDEIICIFDIPGADKEKINVNIEKDILTLSAEIESVLPETVKLIHREYKVGSYRREFTLGNIIDKNKINAKYKNGVLTVILPKAEEEKPKQIEIKVEK